MAHIGSNPGNGSFLILRPALIERPGNGRSSCYPRRVGALDVPIMVNAKNQGKASI